MMEEMDEERDVDYIIDEERDSPSMRYVTLEPNWEATCLWFATALSTHEFDYGAKAPVVTLIEQVRHLTKTDPEALDRIIERLK